MKLFVCQVCEQLLYFENVRCERCERTVGYIPQLESVAALEPLGVGVWSASADAGKRYKFCQNSTVGVCNWLLPADDPGAFCLACRHNHTVPDLSVPANVQSLRRLEAAKHRLFYTLIKLRLPLANRDDDTAHGLAFDFLADGPNPHAGRVMTGHEDGLITVAAKESDDVERERARVEMGETYRTLLGHFRHEVGHYYWNVLVRDRGAFEAFRAMFGDERQDYAATLQSHYANGPPGDWPQRFVSAYASMHPWEDFAETWAHYLHIVDTLETAQSFGLRVQARAGSRTELEGPVLFYPHIAPINELISAWLPLTFAANSLNRSMGQADLYPFVLSPVAIQKIGFVRDLIYNAAQARAQA